MPSLVGSEMCIRDSINAEYMGCRNVSKLFVPEGYSFVKFFEANESWNDLANHNKYRNNYDYYKSIFLVNSIPFADNGFLLLKEDRAIASPVSVINFEKYGNLEVVEQELNNHSENIQCVIGSNETFATNIPFGKAQQPELWDYADRVDTMKFLVNLQRINYLELSIISESSIQRIVFSSISFSISPKRMDNS
eukprot:TRINITY_DN20581_c0_g1_i1.p1 TRINITY_DN20581_c0_g1~~TRINITY_DN20581_c0_g1_i1.p1  ORF type:complete len:193 (-),score=15.54 TRINITY_DN20581_c0_g1_i1:312-890(-)